MFRVAISVLVLSAIVVAGPGGRGGNQGGRGGKGPRGPPFLQNVTSEGRQAYFDIVSNENLTIAEIDTETATWATTYNVSDAYTEFQANQTALQTAIKANVTAVVANLPSVQSQLETILDNKDQTRAAQRNATEILRQQYPIEVSVLFSIARPQGPGGPGGNGGREGPQGPGGNGGHGGQGGQGGRGGNGGNGGRGGNQGGQGGRGRQ